MHTIEFEERQYAPPKPGEPALHAAARTGDHDAIRALVAGGEDIERVFDIGLHPDCRERLATPLMVAAGSGDGASAATVELLLELGADPAHVADDESAVTFACEGLGWNYRLGGDAARLRLLLEQGAPLPGTPSTANALLCETARSGAAEQLGVLLECGVPAQGYWDADRARLEEARARRYADAHNPTLDEFADLPEELRASFAETEAKRFEQAVSAPYSSDIPLFCAAESGNAACVRLLLDAGADLEQRDNSERTAMYLATSSDTVQVLLDAGLPLEDSDRYGWSPLVNALSEGEDCLGTLRALLDAGADVNGCHDHGYTVFMSAVGSDRRPEVLRLLVESGADPHAISEHGYNAFHAAIDVNFGANAEASVRDTLGYLKELGVDIEHRNKRGHTPLARAIEDGTALEVAVLCDLGADPNAVCSIRQCGAGSCGSVDVPLLFAAADGTGVDRDAKTRSLLEAGADPLVTDSEGFTPLVRAVAALCSQADDYEASFKAFFEGVSQLRTTGTEIPAERDQFLEQAMPPLRRFVEGFAAAIPVPQHSKWDGKIREERVRCIELLTAFEGWARHQRKESAPPA